MSNYLVLHFDVEFIAGIVYTGNGNSVPIKNDDEELLWLYFFNDPHQNRVTFGKENKKHFNNLELNYYGNFVNQIADENVKFNLRGIQRPTIDFLEYSGLLEMIQKKYIDITNEPLSGISTLITFSLSINDISKIKIINYLKSKNFIIISFSIPLSELICYHFWKINKIKAKNGKIVLLMKATNSTLHLMKLLFADDYFLIDDTKTLSIKGQGYDPRKKSIVNFVVNEANKSSGVLSNQEELDHEYERYESFADEWLKRIDANCVPKRPINITSINLSPAPSILKDVLVRKTDIECDTGSYIKELEDQYNLFECRNITEKSTIASVILFGDCFNNSQIKKRFENHVDKDSLLILNTNDIFSVMATYPTIDFKRYADTEERIRVQAKLDELATKKRLEDLISIQKEKEDESKRLEDQRIIEKNKKKAKEFLDKARDLTNMKKLLDAKVNVENALELDPQNKEILDFFESLMKKIKEGEKDTKKYKDLLIEAEELMECGNCNEALVKYEQAKAIADGPAIRSILVETKTKIEELEKTKQELKNFLGVIEMLVDQKKFLEAKNKFESVLHLYSKSEEFNNKLIEINLLIGQQEIIFNNLVKEGDAFMKSEKYENAEKEYNKALVIRPNNKHCEAHLKRISEIHQQKAQQKEDYTRAIKSADEQFSKEEWAKAKEYYTNALNIHLKDQYAIEKIKKCDLKVSEINGKFLDLQIKAEDLINKGKKQQALQLLEDALKLKPNEKVVLSRIKKIELDIDFDEPIILKQSEKKSKPSPKSPVTIIESGSIGEVTNMPKVNSPIVKKDDFLKKKLRSPLKEKTGAEDDFLGKGKKNSTETINKAKIGKDEFIVKSGTSGKVQKSEQVNTPLLMKDDFLKKKPISISKVKTNIEDDFLGRGKVKSVTNGTIMGPKIAKEEFLKNKSNLAKTEKTENEGILFEDNFIKKNSTKTKIDFQKIEDDFLPKKSKK